jgi:hypothetical protein
MKSDRLLRTRVAILPIAAFLGLLPTFVPATAQTNCGSTGPDLIIADLSGVANYNAENGIEAFAFGHAVCNIGQVPAAFAANTNAHPVFGKNLYKLTLNHSDGSTRFEQLGYSWLLHGFFALQGPICCTCEPTDGSTLGAGCSDTNTASISGSQPGVGPKWQVNPATGAFPFPHANPSFTGTIARRLQVRLTDLAPSSTDVRYFVEGVVISADDALAGNGDNNASYRAANVSGSETTWNVTFTGTTVRELPAIYAWAAAVPDVRIAVVDVPDDGRLIVAGRANPIANSAGFWHYEYAAYNLNSARAIGGLSLALSSNVAALNDGFHDVAYHSGDGPNDQNFDGQDWTFTTISGPGFALWETQPFAENPAANALRWGTLYNFRFDAQAPPSDGQLDLELFAPGTPLYVQAGPLPAPALRTGDTNGDGTADLADLANLLATFGFCTGETGFDAAADFDRDGCITLSDLALLLSVFGS